jgi:hypothetical protein
MKSFYILLLLVGFTSCSSIKFKELELDVTQELKGSVKAVKSETLYYNSNYKDSIARKMVIVISYDKKRNVLNQTDFYPKNKVETIYNYNDKGLLESTISGYVKQIRKASYKYDKNNNLTEYSQFQNDTLIFTKSIEYDDKNNSIKRTYSHFKYPNRNSVEKIINDYKQNSRTITSFDDKDKKSNSFSKMSFNKKGYLIKFETIDKNLKVQSYSTFEYDGRGNLTKSTYFDENGSIKSTITANGVFDKEGNIILRERYRDDKIFEKTTYEITYY